MTQETLKLALEALENHTAIKHPQQIHYRDKAIAAIKEALAQRTWVGLTDDEMEATFLECGGKWNGDFWEIEDADFHPHLRTIEAKLKEKNT